MKYNRNETDKIKVSVIVPVYNSEKYLRQCMDSICMQTLTEIEIICVDDGSTDASYSILEEYQRRDDRISLYQESNRTAGTARNLGKAHANGEYMIFWDSDDYFDLHALEYMYEKASAYQADVCVCGAGRYYEDWQMLVPRFPHYMNKKKTPKQDVFNMESNPDNILLFTTAAPWNKLFRRAFIEEKHLDFQEVRNGNDVYFVACALCMAERIVTLEQALIIYRVHLQENLTGSTAKAPLTTLKAWEAAAETLEQCGRFPERSFANRALKAIVYMLRNIKEYAAFEEAIDYLKKSTLEKVHLQVREEGFYDTAWYNGFIKCLYDQSAENIMIYLAYMTYMEQMKALAKRQLADREVKTKNQEIKTKNLQIDMKDREIETKDLEIATKNREIEMKEQEIAAKEMEIAAKNREIETKDQEIAAKNHEIKQNKKKTKELAKQIDQLRGSLSFRIGRIITWLPRKIRKAISKTGL